MQIRTDPASASATCDCARSRIDPPKPTKSICAKAPKAANVAMVGFPIASEVIAKRLGITTAVRVARRSAPNPGSRALTHDRTEPTRANGCRRTGALAVALTLATYAAAAPARARSYGGARGSAGQSGGGRVPSRAARMARRDAADVATEASGRRLARS